MALTGSYRINFTDPKKGSFLIEPYTANGTVTATSNTLHPKATRADTSLLLYGQYMPNYGEQIHENFLRLLENFCGETKPSNPVEGQLWYDVGDSFSIIGLTSSAVIIEGNQTALLGQYAVNNTTLTVWYGPLNSINNTYASLNCKVSSASVLANGTTQATMADTNGNALVLPASTVGGFITVAQESGLGRLRVAVKGDGEFNWVDVVSIPCSETVPTTETRQNGDVWFDTARKLFKVYLNGVWEEVTQNHLPLSGGAMAGPINMGGNPITYTGPITDGSTLVHKSYVDATVASAVLTASTGTNAAITDLQTRVVTLETDMPEKLARDGGNIRGYLVFGDDSTTTVLSEGLDMQNRPIINTGATWSAIDYLAAATEGNYVVNKQYIAQALSQHLADVTHEPAGYILRQPDGSGVIPGNIRFAADHSLYWTRNGTQYSAFVRENAFVITTGSEEADTIELRHGSQPPQLTNPSLAISGTYVSAFQTLYLHDGQPQPLIGGGVDDRNDDTAAASKGFVRTVVAEETAGLHPVIGASFDSNAGANSYTLSLPRNGADDVKVNLFHTHRASTMTYSYVELGEWPGGDVDAIKAELEAAGIDLMEVPMSTMLTSLNQHKAAIVDARFVNTPLVGTEFNVLSVDVATNRFELDAFADTLLAGQTINLITFDARLNFTVVASVEEVDNTIPGDPWTSYWVEVEELVPTDHDPDINTWTIKFGWLTSRTEGQSLITRTTLDYMVDPIVDDVTNLQTTVNTIADDVTDLQTTVETKAAIRTPDTFAVSMDALDTHNQKITSSSSSTAVTYTIPTGLPDNWSTVLWQKGTGQITIAPVSGSVTLQSANGLKSRARYSRILIEKIGSTETYLISGDTAV